MSVTDLSNAELIAQVRAEDEARIAREAKQPATYTCQTCGAMGGSYFFGHSDPWAAHPYYTSTGSEGRCDLCGGPADAVVHTAHDALDKATDL